MTHTITVTRLPDATADDVDYTIDGEHDGACEVFTECRKLWHRHPVDDERVGDEWAYKGQLHQYIDGMWMVPSPGYCGVALSFGETNYDEELSRAGLGTHAILLHWDDNWWFEIVKPRHSQPTTQEALPASAVRASTVSKEGTQ